MSSLLPTSSPAEGPVPSPRLPLHLHPASLARPILVKVAALCGRCPLTVQPSPQVLGWLAPSCH